MTNRTARPPNIILFLPDQMRGDCFGAAGHPVVQTPNIDELAAKGVRFRNAFSPSPLCVPARAQILSGRWGHETGNRWDNRSWKYRTETPIDADGVILDPDVLTLGHALTQAGYVTGTIGKCHFYPRLNPLGFMVREDGQSSGCVPAADDAYLRFLQEQDCADLWLDGFGKLSQVDPNPVRPGQDRSYRLLPYVSSLPRDLQFTQWCGDRTLAFLERFAEERPVFVQVGFHAPHDPYCVSPPDDSRYDWRSIDLPPLPDNPGDFPSWRWKGEAYGMIDPGDPVPDEEMKRNWAHYLANIAFVDEQVGRVIDMLQRKGLYDNTLLIFASDHGDHMGQHYRYGKSTFFEESIHVPMVCSGGAVTRRGVADELVTLMDLFPTILNAAGCDVPDDLRDSQPLDLVDGSPAAGRTFVFGELGEGERAQYMVRSATHKYIRHPAQRAEEFFDLAADPLELRNLAGAGCAELERMRSELDSWCAESRPRFYVSDFLEPERA